MKKWYRQVVGVVSTSLLTPQTHGIKLISGNYLRNVICVSCAASCASLTCWERRGEARRCRMGGGCWRPLLTPAHTPPPICKNPEQFKGSRGNRPLCFMRG